MKLLLQKVSRVTVEVDSCVEHKLGAGLVLHLAVRKGDTVAEAQSLGAKVAKLKLWPELEDPEKLYATSLVDNGFEALVVLQQSLATPIAASTLTPSFVGAMSVAEAEPLYKAFVKALRKQYEEEMIVTVPLDREVRLEIAGDGACMFQIGLGESGANQIAAKVKEDFMADRAAAVLDEVDAGSLPSVTRALDGLSMLPLTKATLHACRVYRAFGTQKFRDALVIGTQAETDEFALALDGAGKLFSKRQQEQITKWTGLTIAATAEDEAGELAEEHASGPSPRPGTKAWVKSETEEAHGVRPDLTGKAAPNTPASNSARMWAAQRGAGASGNTSFVPGGKGGGKGLKGPRPFRSFGIASLDMSARLHGGEGGSYERGQLARYSDRELHFQNAKEEEFDENADAEGNAVAKRPRREVKLPKGTPTLAPMCPTGEDDSGLL